MAGKRKRIKITCAWFPLPLCKESRPWSFLSPPHYQVSPPSPCQTHHSRERVPAFSLWPTPQQEGNAAEVGCQGSSWCQAGWEGWDGELLQARMGLLERRAQLHAACVTQEKGAGGQVWSWPHIQRAACGDQGKNTWCKRKEREGNGNRAPPHHCSGAVLPDSYFLHDYWGQILNVFLQTIDGCSLCSAVISPHHELAWSSTCAHLHRKAMKLLRNGEYAHLR